MTRDYESLVPRMLRALFPDDRERSASKRVLAAYGVESGHREQARVHLGILRVSGADLDRLARQTELACTDYRDLLVSAEYPRTWRHWTLRESDPDAYRALAEQEAREYDEWLAHTLGLA